MAMINISSVRQHTLRLLDKIVPGKGIELLSYKRDRSIAVIKLQGELYSIQENGFAVQEVSVNKKQLSRTLKTMIKREFPRSRKVRVVKLSDAAELDRHRPKI